MDRQGLNALPHGLVHVLVLDPALGGEAEVAHPAIRQLRQARRVEDELDRGPGAQDRVAIVDRAQQVAHVAVPRVHARRLVPAHEAL